MNYTVRFFLLTLTAYSYSAESSYQGETLYTAAQRGKSIVVKTLLRNGANPNGEFLGNYPLHQACIRKHNNVIKILVEAPEIDLNLVNRHGVTPLWIVCANKNIPMIKLLLQKGANPNISNPVSKYRYPLINAVVHDDREVIDTLLTSEGSFALDINGEDADGKTALDYAIEAGNQPLIDLLWSHQAISFKYPLQTSAFTQSFIPEGWLHFSEQQPYEFPLPSIEELPEEDPLQIYHKQQFEDSGADLFSKLSMKETMPTSFENE